MAKRRQILISFLVNPKATWLMALCYQQGTH